MGQLALHGAIDDATGQLIALYLTYNECMEGYFELMRRIIQNYGIPLSLYTDRHTIFVSPNKDKLSIEEQLEGKTVNQTQFERAMSELDITIINARSPLFRKLSSNIDLDNVLCIKKTRTVDNGGIFSLDGQYYQLVDEKGKIVPVTPRAKITVLTSPKIGIRAQYSNNIYAVQKLDEPPRKAQKVKQAGSSSRPKSYKPAPDHPWRQGHQKTPSYWYVESNREILNALYNSTCAWR